MVDGDIFREVEEELKREQFSRLWDKYGYLVVGAAIAIIALVAGYKYWNYQQQQQAELYGSKFMQALELAETPDNRDKAGRELAEIANNGPRGYAMLAQMREAALKASGGKLAEAVAEYDKLAGSTATDPVFRDFARIQAAMLRVDKADEAEMQDRLGKLADGSSSWRHSARELLGLSAYRAGKLRVAENYYNQLLGDRTTPGGIRQRAEVMLALIVEDMAGKEKPSTDANASANASGGADTKGGKTTGSSPRPESKAPAIADKAARTYKIPAAATPSSPSSSQ